MFSNYYKHKTNGICSDKNGVALILAMGVLVLIFSIGLFLIEFFRIEVTKAKTDVNLLRASFAANSGFQRAIIGLKTFAQNEFIARPQAWWVYYGEDIKRNWTLDSGEDINGNGKLDIDSLPLEEALMPSFPDTKSGILTIDGTPQMVSGIIEKNENSLVVYSLKILETSNKININSNGKGVELLLNNLAKVLGISQPIGTILQGYKNEKQNSILTISDLKTIWGEEIIEKVKPYITYVSWIDDKTIKPKPYYERNNILQLDKPVPSLVSYYPGQLELEGRAPININTAPEEIVLALLMNLEGTYIDEAFIVNSLSNMTEQSFKTQFLQPILECKKGQTKNKNTDYPLGILRKIKITEEKARQITDLILKRRSVNASSNRPAFLSQNDLHLFFTDLVEKKIITRIESDLLEANLNPNTDLNKFNPNGNLFKYVDKTDLLSYTTEVTFGPTGYFEIESLGLVIENGQTVASKKVSAIVKIFDIIRDTTQEDFMKGSINYPAGDYITSNGKTLQIYPESHLTKQAAGCKYDGQIMLSTLSLKSFLKKSDIHQGFNTITDLKQLFAAGLETYSNSLFNEYEKIPGNLTPDGIITTLGYPLLIPLGSDAEDTRNITISFWVKPYFSLFNALPRSVFHGNLSTDKMDGRINFVYHFNPYEYIQPQATLVYPFSFYCATIIENPKPNDNFSISRRTLISSGRLPFLSKYWTHLAIHFVMVRGYLLEASLYVNGERVYKDNAFLTRIEETPIGKLKIENKNYLVFGGTKNEMIPCSGSLEATIDEIIIQKTKGEEENRIKQFYHYGRYYPGNDAVFISRPIFTTKNKVTLGTISWTDNVSNEIWVPGYSPIYYSAISFQILDNNNKELLKDPVIFSSGSSLNKLTVPTSFRYKINFNTPLPPEVIDKVFLNSPVIDDVTITLLLDSPEIIYPSFE